MKIRAGFVSNSSSTSFLIISKKDLNKKDFFELMGIRQDSPIADLFDQFYQDVINSADKVDFRTAPKSTPFGTLFDNSRGRLSEHMIAKLKEAQKDRLTAYFGWLDSESTPIQTFFCTDSFELENDKIYFNGLENIW